MPKSVVIDPENVRKPATLKINEIAINQYNPNIQKETEKYSAPVLKQMLSDMILIREFETCLNMIKTQGMYQNIPFQYRGPAHLSIGQEAAAVGLCHPLSTDDQIFGSHRSHGEVLAKCLSAIRKYEEKPLQDILENYMDGTILKIAENGFKGTTKELAVRFILYGVLAEIFAKETGVNKGLGGSMQVFFAPFGSMPNNAIVGGSADISVGAALFKRINRKKGIVICNIGDGASACGPTWEAIMLASMDQYRKLWDKDIGGAPPILFNFFNNFYGMGGQTYGETMGFDVLARIGAGVNADAMHSERVDGYNPVAVSDAVERKYPLLEKGQGPVLMDTLTYRFSGHSPSDASSYRSREEVNLWRNQDCIDTYSAYLIKGGTMTEDEVKQLKGEARDQIITVLKLAIDEQLSPYMPIKSELIGDVMFSNRKLAKLDDREPEVLMSKEDNPRLVANNQKSRFGLDENGKALAKTNVLMYRDALFEAMLEGFYTDPTMVAFGEENRDWGGAFGVYRGLTEALPYHRLFNSPISEGAIAGAAAGYAMCGGRVVAELMYCDFLGRSGDEVFNQISKWQAMSAGQLKMPLVLRISVGSKYGAQHSQDWTAMVAHVPGLKVYYPATPYDAKGMLHMALNGSDPVIFFESQKSYDVAELFEKTGVPETNYELKEGQPAIRREGGDITIVAVGPALYTALDASDILKDSYGVQAEVIDARFINPLKYDVIIESIRKTGKLLLVSDACERGSFLNTVAAQITQFAFDELDAPPIVVGSRNWITPAAELEEMYFPQKEWIIDAIHERILPLKGHAVSSNQTLGEQMRRNKLGI